MTSPKVDVPPKAVFFSISKVRSPRLAAAMAAVEPAVPPPTITDRTFQPPPFFPHLSLVYMIRTECAINFQAGIACVKGEVLVEMEGDKVRHTILQTPRGLADLVGREVALMHLIEEKLSKLLASWGYQEVHTPTIEFADVLAKGSEGELKDAFCFIDRQGDLVALRPEMTTPCARLLASRLLSQPMPIRLFYAGRVFRYEEPQEGRNREFRQIGVELAGLPAPVGDAEVVALAVHAFETLGLEDFQFTVSHIGILEGLLEAAGIDKEDRHRLAPPPAAGRLRRLQASSRGAGPKGL